MEAGTDGVAVAPAPANSLAPGTLLQEYRIGAVVGEGGFGIVYRAFDTLLEREVAIKEYLPVSHALRRGSRVEARSASQAPLFAKGLRCFVGEAQMLARFKHPALVEVLRFWEENGTAYMVMPFYRGRTLRDIAQRGQLLKSQDDLVQLLRPLFGGLAVMHGAGCYHRDISVDNILVLDSGAPVLLDFGAARSTLMSEADDATVILKPGFAPIEQYSGDGSSAPQGPWTDIYALSAVLYQVVSGCMPLPSVARIIRDPVVPLARGEFPGFSRAFLEAIDRGMAVRPEDRPQTIAAFERLLLADKVSEPQAPAAEEEDTAAASGLHRSRTARPDPAVVPEEAQGGPGMPIADTQPAVDATEGGRRLLEGVGKGVWIGAGLVLGACALGAVLYLALGMNRAPIVAEVAASGRPQEAVGAPPEDAAEPAVTAALASAGAAPDPVSSPSDSAPVAMAGAAGSAEDAGAANRPSQPLTDAQATRPSGEVDDLSAPSAGGAASPDEAPASASALATATATVTAASAESEAQPSPGPLEASEIPAVALPHPTPSSTEMAAAAGEGAALAAERVSGGSILVTVRPWGRVYLNGELVGTVPPRLRIPAPVGASEIEIRNESHPPHVVQVRVREGGTVRVSHDFLLAEDANRRADGPPSASGER